MKRGVFFVVVFLLTALCAAPQAVPSLTIDEEVTAYAFAPDGRIAYAVRHTFGVKKLQLQRDDIWVSTLEGKKTRIIDGKKLFEKAPPFSYAVQSLRWSPDGARLAVEMFTSTMAGEQGDTKEGYVTWLLDAAGKEIHVAGGSAMLEDAANSAWLSDGATLAFMREAMSPKLLSEIRTVRPASGGGDTPFPGRTFSAVVWDVHLAGGSAAVAIERDTSLSGSIRLVRLDIFTRERRELAQLAGYLGQLSVSPSGKLVAYFRDQETLEVREVARPERVARVRVAYGPFVWAADEQRLLIKRGTFDTSARGSGRRSGSLAWLTLPPLEALPAKPASSAAAPKLPPANESQLKNLPDADTQPALSGLLFQNFAISPDGRFVAVTAPGSRPLQVFPIR